MREVLDHPCWKLRWTPRFFIPSFFYRYSVPKAPLSPSQVLIVEMQISTYVLTESKDILETIHLKRQHFPVPVLLIP